MRGRTNVVCLALVAAGLAMVTAGCGGSGQATGPEAVTAPSGKAVLQGSVQGAGDGLQVSVVGTSLTSAVDGDGQFLMSSLPAGTVTLRFEGAGADAKLAVDGLRDGQVTSITVALSGGSARLAGPPSCSQTADTFFSGNVEQASGGRLLVSGRTVDTSELKKVWRAGRRVELSEVEAGEKVRVWGVLRGDGVVMADEIECLTGGGREGETWTSFSGKVESVSSGAFAGLDLHADPNRNKTMVVAGRTVKTDGGTNFVWSDRSPLDPAEVKAGQNAYVEGWKNAEGTVRATTFRVEGSGAGSLVSFKGRVEKVAEYDRGGPVVELGRGGVTAACNLELTIAGRKVRTDGSTVFKWSDGSDLDYTAIVVGDTAAVEGRSQPGYVQATRLVVNTR